MFHLKSAGVVQKILAEHLDISVHRMIECEISCHMRCYQKIFRVPESAVKMERLSPENIERCACDPSAVQSIGKRIFIDCGTSADIDYVSAFGQQSDPSALLAVPMSSEVFQSETRSDISSS